MIETFVSDLFKRTGFTWRIGGKELLPTEEDVLATLDAAAGKLYDYEDGTQLSSSGLIIEKSDAGHKVYVYVGTYK